MLPHHEYQRHTVTRIFYSLTAELLFFKLNKPKFDTGHIAQGARIKQINSNHVPHNAPRLLSDSLSGIIFCSTDMSVSYTLLGSKCFATHNSGTVSRYSSTVPAELSSACRALHQLNLSGLTELCFALTKCFIWDVTIQTGSN